MVGDVHKIVYIPLAVNVSRRSCVPRLPKADGRRSTTGMTIVEDAGNRDDDVARKHLP